MSPLTPRPGDPVLAPLTLVRPLAGPGDPARPARAGEGLVVVTGGGLAALLDPTRGLRSLWRGPVQAADRLVLRWGRNPLHPARRLRVGRGSWERRIPLPAAEAGGELVERGVLLDSAPVLLIGWHVEAGSDRPRPSPSPLTVELHPSAGRAAIVAELDAGLGPVGLAILPPGEMLDSVSSRIDPPHARERARQGRFGDGLEPVEPRPPDGPAALPLPPSLPGALQHLSDAPLGMDVEGNPTGPFLLGVHDQRPRYARGTELAEIGVGALQGGFPSMAWSALEALLADPSPPSLPTVHLASELARWTGELTRIAPLRHRLAPLIAALAGNGTGAAAGEDSPTRAAAFPGPARVLSRLAEGVQRTGAGWSEELEAAARALVGRSRRSSGSGGSPPRRQLPVVGDATLRPPAARTDARASLPPPEAFGPVDHSGVRPHLTLHAARLVRSWMEGALGIDPDAPYGRLVLAPDLGIVPPAMGLRGVRVGASRIGLACRYREGVHSIRVFQESGPVPLNVVFQPTVPWPLPLQVTIGGESADVSARAAGAGTELSLQFPLDPERRIVIERAS